MVDQSDIEVVETTDEHYRFQFRNRSAFEELVDAPDWAQEAADTIVDGASVQLGRLPDADALQVESVRVPRKHAVGEEDAKNMAEEIVEEVHSR